MRGSQHNTNECIIKLRVKTYQSISTLYSNNINVSVGGFMILNIICACVSVNKLSTVTGVLGFAELQLFDSDRV